jgi:tagaturonate reductase
METCFIKLLSLKKESIYMQLSKKILSQLKGKISSVPAEAIFNLPEKVLQFGTGVLLRGLPDYYIDKANKQHIFNGRIVMVKSTDEGGVDAYTKQDGLYTHSIRGIQHQQLVDEYIINASLSKVFSAKSQWKQVLACAANPELQVIISNTTEVGIVLIENDNIKARPPVSFPGKLLAFLYERYKIFKGDVNKGFIIVPTELITDNGTKLQSIVMELAHLNKFDYAFIDWLENANCFCNSLVDRIVPGKLQAAQLEEAKKRTGYEDELMIMSEVYSLWAIETANPKVKEVLSFARADASVIITDDINNFRELKLRLLNGTHTFSCGLAHLAGFETVKEAMEDKTMSTYIHDLMVEEIAPCISGNAISSQEAMEFSNNVMERFRNPFIEHLWLNITLNYTHKMRMRNVPLLLEHYRRFSTVPENMAMGFAAYLLFMKSEPSESGKYYGEWNGTLYPIQDEHAAYFGQLWRSDSLNEIVIAALSNEMLWGNNLNSLPEFSFAVATYLELFLQNKVIATLKQHQLKKNKVESHEA